MAALVSSAAVWGFGFITNKASKNGVSFKNGKIGSEIQPLHK
jgi:hypothetical protein